MQIWSKSSGVGLRTILGKNKLVDLDFFMFNLKHSSLACQCISPRLTWKLFEL